ncbi:MAG: hypothetical protein ACR2MT_17500 [Aurantibacter sp.]
MDVFYTIIENTSLNGMPKWYKAATLFLFSVIVSMLLTMLVTLLIHGPYMNIQFGY